jgi:OmpA-OmpF porin, OOP family
MHKKLAAGLALTACAAAQAQDAGLEDPRWYFSPMVGYLVTDSDRDADNEVAGYLGLGKPLSEHVNMEMFVHGANVSVDDQGSPRLPSGAPNPAYQPSGQQQWRGAGVSGMYVFSRNPGFSPYAQMGASGMRTEFQGDSTWNPVGEAGVGFFSRVLGDTSLRADVRARFNFDNDTVPGESRLDDTVASLGIAIPLGTRPARPEPVAQAPAPVPAPEPPAPQTIKETVILEGVNFCFDCYHLSEQAKAILDTNARKVIDANIGSPVEIAGHTDSIGTDEYNQGLSQRRVDSVREYLVAKGVDGTKLTAKGYGESQPIADNATAEGRARNRRVELRVME